MSSTQTRPLTEVARSLDGERVRETDGEPHGSSDADNVPMAVRLDFAVLLTAEEHAALRAPESPFGALPDLPPALYAAWRIRIDLYKTFDLSTTTGFAGLWNWAIGDGRREIDALRAPLADARERLTAPVLRSIATGLPVRLPWIAAILWCARPDLQAAFPANPKSIAGFLGWFLKQGVQEMRCGDLLPPDHVQLLSAPGEGSTPPPFTLYLDFIHAARPDLRAAFDISSFEGRRAFLKWFFDHGKNEFPTHPDILARQTKIVFEWGETIRQDQSRPDSGPQATSDGSDAARS